MYATHPRTLAGVEVGEQPGVGLHEVAITVAGGHTVPEPDPLGG
jgi:hypothetical protein